MRPGGQVSTMAVRGPSGPSGAHQNLTNVSPKSPGTPLLQKRTRDFCSRLLPGVAQGTGTAHAVPVPPGVRPVSLFCAWPVSPWVSVLGVLICPGSPRFRIVCSRARAESGESGQIQDKGPGPLFVCSSRPSLQGPYRIPSGSRDAGCDQMRPIGARATPRP